MLWTTDKSVLELQKHVILMLFGNLFPKKKHTIHRNQFPSAIPYDSSHSFSKKQTFWGLFRKTLLLKFTYCETSAVILEWDSHLIHHTSSAFDLWRGVSTLLSGFYLYTLVWTWPSGSCFVSRSKSCLTTDPAIKVFSFIRNVKSEVACSQVWWPIQGICALHLTHLSAHTHTHTHTVNTMLRRPGISWGFCGLLNGLTSVMVLKVKKALVIHSLDQQLLTDLRLEPLPALQVTSPTLYPLRHDYPLCIKC